MNKAYIQFGSNIGERINYIQEAVRNVNITVGNIVTCSAIYESEAWGLTDQNDFLNVVSVVETNLTAKELLTALQHIERKMGRVRKTKWEARKIDIDILFFNQEIIEESGLKVPHPCIQERKFVLIPMNEINAGFIHPLLKKNMAALLDECTDKLNVWKYDVQNDFSKSANLNKTS